MKAIELFVSNLEVNYDGTIDVDLNSTDKQSDNGIRASIRFSINPDEAHQYPLGDIFSIYLDPVGTTALKQPKPPKSKVKKTVSKKK